MLCVLQPATTHGPLGMRKVKSTSNFAQSAHQYAPMHSMHVSMAMPSSALRASPSMPSFPMAARHMPKEEPVDVAGLPHIAEERDDPLRLPDNVASMFLDEHDLAGSDDLMTLMKDIQGAAPSALDLELGLEPGADGGGASGETAGGGGAAAPAPVSPTVGGEPGGDGMDPEPAASAPHSVDGLDPAFFNLDGYDQLGMTMLDDDFTSAFLDA